MLMHLCEIMLIKFYGSRWSLKPSLMVFLGKKYPLEQELLFWSFHIPYKIRVHIYNGGGENGSKHIRNIWA